MGLKRQRGHSAVAAMKAGDAKDAAGWSRVLERHSLDPFLFLTFYPPTKVSHWLSPTYAQQESPRRPEEVWFPSQMDQQEVLGGQLGTKGEE